MQKNDTNPLVSVVVTTYNREQYLRETLESIVSQTYANLDIIVVDNNSNYDFMRFISTFNDSRIKAYVNKNHGVIAKNRNFGIRKAKAKYIAFCDDDDIWLPTKIQMQMKAMVNYNVIGIGCNVIPFGEVGTYRKKKIPQGYLTFRDLFTRTISLSTLLIRNTNTLFNEGAEYHAVEDAEFQFRLLRDSDNRFYVVADALAKYRIHGTGGDRILQNRKNFMNVLRKYKNALSTKEYEKLCSNYHMSLGIHALKTLNSERRMYFKKALEYRNKDKVLLKRVLSILSRMSDPVLSYILKVIYLVK